MPFYMLAKKKGCSHSIYLRYSNPVYYASRSFICKFSLRGKQPCAYQHCFFTNFILYIHSVMFVGYDDHHQECTLVSIILFFSRRFFN